MKRNLESCHDDTKELHLDLQTALNALMMDLILFPNWGIQCTRTRETCTLGSMGFSREN